MISVRVRGRAIARLGRDAHRRRTRAEVEVRICAARERAGWGPRLIAGETGVAHSTVHAVLKRHDCSRAGRTTRREFVRYEWPCPGDRLHLDVKRYPRFRRPGHAVTGDRQRPLALGLRRAARRRTRPDRRRRSRTRVDLVRAHDITVRRLMTDGAMAYRNNRALRELIAEHAIHHILTPPYTPRWNGKVERFHQTMEREWAKGLRYRNSSARNRALPHWLRHYNQRSPQLTRRPTTISRAHNLPRQDN
jgi:hypothetical protein